MAPVGRQHTAFSRGPPSTTDGPALAAPRSRGRFPDIPTTSAPRSAPTFTDLGVPRDVVDALAARDITEPTPIQRAAIADALAGRDVLGRGRTGSGKTLAFGLPLLTRLTSGRTVSKRPRGLVLLPTRELASQVRDALAPLAEILGLRQTVVYGGVGQGRQADALRQGVDLLIACPGRLEDLIGQGLVDLDRVEVTVLDEADHMSDLGFLPAVRRLLRRTPRDGQRMLFSATLDGEVDRLVREFLHDAVTHSVDAAEEPVPDMTHHLFTVAPADRNAVVQELASGHGRSMMFTRTKHAARKLSRQLTAAGIPADRAARQPLAARPRPEPGGLLRRRRPRAGRHRHRRARHPRRRRRPRGARRPARRAQGVHPPLRAHGARRLGR